MQKIAALLALALCFGSSLGAQNPPASLAAKPEYSGMYAFLQEGEFVQITVEDDGRVTGFVSRYGNGDSDRGAFLDQFFKDAKLEGKKLKFTTQTVHGVWYEFKGSIERGDGKNPGDEGYYLLKGTLIQNTTDASKKTSSKARDVAFKSFPQNMDDEQTKP